MSVSETSTEEEFNICPLKNQMNNEVNGVTQPANYVQTLVLTIGQIIYPPSCDATESEKCAH